MTITLYDLAAANPDLRFSPFCWRTKLALRHKGLAYDTIPWRFTEKTLLAPSGGERVPAINDHGRWVHDSWTIANYLDDAYSDAPKLFPDDASRVHAQFINSWCDWAVLPNSRELSIRHVFAIIAEKDKAWFRETREKIYGAPIEAIGADRAAAQTRFWQALKPADVMLTGNNFLHGTAPGYGDYALFGTLLWPYTVVPEPVIPEDKPLGRWFARMLALNDGWVTREPTVRGQLQQRNL